MRRRLCSRVSLVLFLSCFPEFIFTATSSVTLESVEIFKTHEWLPVEPQVYFTCKGENNTFLPDVKKINVVYTFKGQESWQPLTEFPNKKCKRCGFYEKDSLKSDDVFGEWEFCPDDFTVANGKHVYSVEKEFNATFSCQDCLPIKADIEHSSGSLENNDKHHGGRRMHWTVVVLISALASSVLIVGLTAAYKLWQKKKREHEQARFLRLFEEGDDSEDELGIGPFGGSV